MTCDHDATRASFAAFFGGTKLLGGQDDGAGNWLLLGTCTVCNTTLAIPIATPRGTVVHGEIVPAAVHEAMQNAPHGGKLYRQARAAIGALYDPLTETPEEMARRLIK